MNNLMYFTILYAISKEGQPLTKEQVMEEETFWAIGYKGIEWWGFPLKFLMHKYYA